MKLLFDMFPVILFFVVFKLAGLNPDLTQALANHLGYHADPKQLPILLATAVAILATVVQIIWTKIRNGKVDTMLWVSFAIIGVFGGATLVLHDETFIKWKPSVLYWLFSVILLGSNILFKKNLIQSMLKEKMALPLRVWNRLNLSWSLFFLILGFINLYVAFNYSTDTWVSFKLFGFTGMMIVFIIGQSAWLSKYIDEKKEEN